MNDKLAKQPTSTIPLPAGLAPNETKHYEELASKGALRLIWCFVQLSPEYRAAWNAHGNTPKSPEALAAARHFGLRELVCPDTATPDTDDFARPVLDFEERDGKFWLAFDLAEEVAPQLRAAEWMLARKTTRYERKAPVVHAYTNHRLAFLLRALHLHISGCESSTAAGVLSEMKRTWRTQLRRTGRPDKYDDYTVRHLRSDIDAATRIRDDLAPALMHEARMSRYRRRNAV